MGVRRLIAKFGIGSEPSADTRAVDWLPGSYRVTATEAGADVNYDCYCGCDAGFAFERGKADPQPESCCCGNRILVGADAGARLADQLDHPDEYRIDSREVRMPWAEELEVALAIPTTGSRG